MPVNSPILYEITDTLNDAVDAGALDAAIRAAGLSTTLDGVIAMATQIKVNFTGPLSDADKTTLDGIVAAHDGNPVGLAVVSRIVISLFSAPVQVTEDQNWQVIAGMVGNPSFFAMVLANLFGQILGEIKTVGAGAQIRLVEYTYAAGTEEEKIAPVALANTADAWAMLNTFTSAGARAGHGRYELQARLNGATSCWIRYVSLGLVERI